ncbi:MAG: ABC transporter ATP-binding protein [Oscillospiraceae bacterium]|nr:ABC transporter ATP-binding protein [Oscillospiraceae bacterium]
MNKVEVVNLSKRFQSFALRDVNFSVPAGYITGFIGKNGMGKTTTIKSLLSLIHYEGKVLFPEQAAERPFDNQKIGVVMDEPFFAKDWDMKLVNRAMKIGYAHWDEDAFFQYLRRFQIDLGLKVKELSRGMKIKLMLAVALSHNAELLILDEPTSGLDPSMREEFAELISEYMEAENHTVLFSSHITQDLEAIADYIVLIDRGRVVLALEKDEFIRSFLVLKGEPGAQEQLPAAALCGKKTGKYNVELLVKREALEKIPAGFVEDAVTLDRIMVLYGREME